MKIVYFIQSHKNPEQICRLVKTIKNSSCNSLVLLSHDFSSCPLDLSNLSHFSGIELIKRYRGARRGDDSVLEIYLEAIEWLFERNFNFDWLICLSGQDYPVRPIPELEAFLATTKHDGFISHWDVFADESPWGKETGRKRFFTQYLKLPQGSKWWLRKLSRIEPLLPGVIFQWRFSLIGLEVKSTPFNDNFKCYGGWYWNVLSRKCVDYLRAYLEEHPQLLKFYRRTLAPEESLIASVLVNSNQFDLSNDCLRYLDYPPELFGFARNLTTEDYSKIAHGNFYFARKFEPEPDDKILDLLDELIEAKATEESTAAKSLGV
ncbi:beta-1,6-N-acetylglucosaminyltransferase [Myxosarcina sp. GI1(2024)]